MRDRELLADGGRAEPFPFGERAGGFGHAHTGVAFREERGELLDGLESVVGAELGEDQVLADDLGQLHVLRGGAGELTARRA